MSDLQKYKLFIGTPMYGSQCHGIYLHSVLSLINLCNQMGIQTGISYLCNESLLQRSRNYVVDEFLRSGFTHLLFLDSDIHFDSKDVITLLSFDKEVIGVPYSMHHIDWNRIVHLVQKGNLSSEEAELLAGNLDYPKEVLQTEHSLVETDILTTGFLLLQRQVFEKLQVAYPEYYYLPDHVGTDHFGGERRIQLFFSVEIDPTTNQLMTEYEFFCQSWKKIGGKIFLCPLMTLHHIGLHTYEI